MSSLPAEVRRVAEAVGAAVTPEDAAMIRRAVQRLDEPLRVAIAGRVKAGKSTLLNAIVGCALAATDAAECTQCVVWYSNGPHYGATLVDRQGQRHPLPLRLDDAEASIDLDGHPIDDVDHLEVTYPTQHLRGLTLIDTPGVASISDQVSARATSFLAPASGDHGADVVIYLLRHLHQSDSDFLEAFTDASAVADPVRSIGVLGRADELGAGRGDSMVLAHRVAERYAGEGVVARRVSSVSPVSGLLALTAATLHQDEYGHLAALAAMPIAATDRLAVSADRFVAESAHCAVPVPARVAMLQRLGLFGIRLCLAAFRAGRVRSIDDLETVLCQVSGIEPLRSQLVERFGARADVLKAARALDVVRSVAERNGVGDSLRRELDRIDANAHELEELRCLGIIQVEEVRLPAGILAAVLRALGADGPSPHQRLGVPIGADAPTCAVQARDTVVGFRRVRARPLLTSQAERVLDAAIVSIERVHAAVTA